MVGADYCGIDAGHSEPFDLETGNYFAIKIHETNPSGQRQSVHYPFKKDFDGQQMKAGFVCEQVV